MYLLEFNTVSQKTLFYITPKVMRLFRKHTLYIKDAWIFNMAGP
jgi:hypothetical protein